MPGAFSPRRTPSGHEPRTDVDNRPGQSSAAKAGCQETSFANHYSVFGVRYLGYQLLKAHMSILLILRGLATAVSAAKSVGTFAEWLDKNGHDPIREAIDATVERVKDDFPAIRDTLIAALGGVEFAARLEEIVLQPDPSLDAVAAELVRVTEFYMPSRSEADASMVRILRAFLSAYDAACLRGDENIAYLDRKSQSRHSEILALTTSNILSGELRARIQDAKKASRGKPYAIAREIWAGEERGIERSLPRDGSLEFEIYSAIANLAFIHEETAEAAVYFKRAHDADPTHPRAAAQLAMSLALRNDAQALSVIAKEPDPERRRIITAQIHLLLGNAPAALGLLRRYLEETVSSDELTLIAASAQATGDLSTAEAAALRLLALMPDHIPGMHSIAFVFAEKARQISRAASPSEAAKAWAQADSAFDRLAQSTSGRRRSEALATRAQISMIVHNTKEASRLIDEALHADGTFEWALILRAQIAFNEKIDRSSLVAPLAEKGDPKAYEVMLKAAHLFDHPAAEANRLIRRAHEIWSIGMPIGVWEAAWALASRLRDDALLATLLTAAPESQFGRVKLARARTLLAEDNRAEAHLLLREAATEMTPDDGFSLVDLAKIAMAVQDYELARQAFEKFGIALADQEDILSPYLHPTFRTSFA
jgi:tetratricopeptide (TPR) repeat protein